jgi:hypothetical protein
MRRINKVCEHMIGTLDTYSYSAFDNPYQTQ